MDNLPWFERNLKFGYPKEMLPYFLERLEGSIVRIQNKVKDVDDKILSTRLNNKWSIKQNIGHLAEVDLIANKRLDEMVNGISPMSPAVFDAQDYNPWPIEKVLELFKTNRVRNLAKYKSIAEGDLFKSSLHPRLKVQMNPIDLAWFDAEHDDHHFVTINRILKELNTMS